MVRWMRLSTFIKLMTNIYNMHSNVSFYNDHSKVGYKEFDFDACKSWRQSVKANDLAIKTATIVMYDRWSDKRALAD